MPKTTKEIYKYVKRKIDTLNTMEDINIASHSQDLWYSQAEYEKLENVLKKLQEWVQNHDCFLDNNEEVK